MLLLKIDKLPLDSVRQCPLLDETTMVCPHCLEIRCRIESGQLRLDQKKTE